MKEYRYTLMYICRKIAVESVGFELDYNIILVRALDCGSTM